jgi:hypothetical protein
MPDRKKFAVRKDEPVICAKCGKRTKRQMRGQRYCSRICRERARERSSRRCLALNHPQTRAFLAARLVRARKRPLTTGGEFQMPNYGVELPNVVETAVVLVEANNPQEAEDLA